MWCSGPCTFLTILFIGLISASSQDHGHKGRNSTREGSELSYTESTNTPKDMEEVLVVRGQKVSLRCSAVSEEDGRFNEIEESVKRARWFHDDREIKVDMRIRWSTTGQLEISHVVSADSGVWRCLAVEGTLGDPIRLVVTIPPERPFLVYAGAQLALGARLTTREGNPLTLHCVVEGGNPAPTLTWHLNRVDISHNSKMRSEWSKAEDRFTTVSNITLPRVSKEHHNSTIACVVTHPALGSPVPVPLRLNIEYSPDFRLLRWPTWGSPLREGASVSLLCLIDANPPSPPVWVRETDGGAQILSGESGWFNITHVSMENRGWYKCTTVHPFGRFASNSVLLNVLGAGKIQIAPPRVIEASLGDSLSLPCTAPGISSHSVCWRRILPDGRHKGISKQNALQLRKVSYKDSGIYKCTTNVDNDTLESEDLQLYVTGSPLMKALNRSVETPSGSTITISVKVCSQPHVLDLMWISPERRSHVFPGETNDRYTFMELTELDIAGCQIAAMKVTKVRPQDSGRWVLLAVNSKGANAALITVNVSEVVHHSVAASTAGASHMHAKPLPTLIISFSIFPLMLVVNLGRLLNNCLSVIIMPLMAFTFYLSRALLDHTLHFSKFIFKMFPFL